MAINVCRARPAAFSQIVHKVKQDVPLAQNCNHTHDLIKKMKHMKPLPAVNADDLAYQACMRNNQAVIARQEMVPTSNGNIVVYTEMKAGQPVNCEEFTFPKYSFEAATWFVALQMIMDYGRMGPLAKHTPVLKPDLVAVGVSMLGHPKTENLVQVLYVKSCLNPPVPIVAVQQQPMVQPMQQPVAVVVEQPVRPMVVGRLKLHLKSAHLQHNDAGFLERMNPFVIIKVNGLEWRSNVCEGGGREPQWTL